MIATNVTVLINIKMNFDTVNLFNITLSQVIELRIKKQGLQDLQERNKWRLSSL